MKTNIFLILFITLSAFIPVQSYAAINIFAAENTYGEVAQEIGGPYVSVTSVLNSPSQDPHLFSTTPSTAQALAHADIVIYNGADYDPWMEVMLKTGDASNKHIICVAELANIKSGANPHIWYEPTVMPKFATALVNKLVQIDPQHSAYYENKLQLFNENYKNVTAKIASIKKRFDKTPVIATEPVFGYMAASLGLVMHGETFQIDVMNDVPPSVSEIKSFEDDLTNHAVHLLIYNNQVINPLTERIRDIATQQNIAVVGVSELIPPGKTYVQWILQELNDVQNALESKKE